MRKLWNSWLKESVFLYCLIYTVVTIANSVLNPAAGIQG